jgi:uncharacterized transporter YbjL
MILMFMPGIGVTEANYEFMSALSGTGIDIIGYSAYKAANPALLSVASLDSLLRDVRRPS